MSGTGVLYVGDKVRIKKHFHLQWDHPLIPVTGTVTRLGDARVLVADSLGLVRSFSYAELEKLS